MDEKVPSTSVESLLAPNAPCKWFYDVRDLCKKAREQGDLTQDEILLLAIAAGQAAYVRYIEPDSAHDAEQTLEKSPRCWIMTPSAPRHMRKRLSS